MQLAVYVSVFKHFNNKYWYIHSITGIKKLLGRIKNEKKEEIRL